MNTVFVAEVSIAVFLGGLAALTVETLMFMLMESLDKDDGEDD